MLEKMFLQSILSRVKKASLIEEAKIHSIKNYTRIPNKELCIQLWNHKEYVNVSNIKRIMTCNKKRSKKEDIAQQIVEKPKRVKKSKSVTLEDSLQNDFSAPCEKPHAEKTFK